MPTNIWNKYGGKSNLISCPSSSESEHGNTDKCPSSQEPTNHPDLTKPEDWATRLRMAMLSTELESEEVEERDLFPRVSSVANPQVSVLIN